MKTHDELVDNNFIYVGDNTYFKAYAMFDWVLKRNSLDKWNIFSYYKLQGK